MKQAPLPKGSCHARGVTERFVLSPYSIRTVGASIARPLFLSIWNCFYIYKNLDYLKTLYYDIAEITPAEW